MSSAARHRPVLPREVIEHLALAPGLVVLDGTVGAAGHSVEIVKRIQPGGRLIGLDRDPMMLRHAEQKLTGTDATLRQGSYAEAAEILESENIDGVDRVLLDLGLSSDQLADEARGFGFDAAGPLDLRFDTSAGQPAWRLLEQIDADALASLLEDYGEERFSRRIAEEVVRRRTDRPVRTAVDLTEAVAAALPAAARNDARKHKKHPATRVFQALRIAVNRELDHLKEALEQTLPRVVRAGGRVVIISFHSLEDRLVKEAFRGDAWQTLTPKPVTAAPAEVRINPRSRTARLRTATRL
jgi:16S rRNA (cytosine1402-N4)-methyltransferase